MLVFTDWLFHGISTTRRHMEYVQSPARRAKVQVLLHATNKADVRRMCEFAPRGAAYTIALATFSARVRPIRTGFAEPTVGNKDKSAA